MYFSSTHASLHKLSRYRLFEKFQSRIIIKLFMWLAIICSYSWIFKFKYLLIIRYIRVDDKMICLSRSLLIVYIHVDDILICLSTRSLLIVYIHVDDILICLFRSSLILFIHVDYTLICFN